jgi:hypothetical protein
MTRLDVELILGGPPGDYRTRPTCGGSTQDTIQSSDLSDDPRVAFWQGDEVRLTVVYDNDTKVQFTAVREVWSLLDIWKWRLTRQCHRWFPE